VQWGSVALTHKFIHKPRKSSEAACKMNDLP